MRSWKPFGTLVFIGGACAIAIGVIAYGTAHLPTGIDWTATSHSPEESRVSYEEPQKDRPDGVGNQLGEELLRKVERPPAVPSSGVIRVRDETFSAAYDELYDRRDTYYGREIELSGYVMYQEDLKDGSFLVGRDLLWCCEEDKYFIGFMASATGTPPEEGTTVIIRGILEPRSYTNPENQKTFTVPAIKVTYLAPMEGVAREVYPN